MNISDKMYDPPEEDFNEEAEGEGGIPSPLTPWYRQQELKNPTTFTATLGPRPEFMNLKDHPELDGVSIAVCNVKFTSGEYGDFCFLGALILSVSDNPKPVKAVVIMTGASDVFARVAMCSNIINNGTPVIGTLRKVGRAWVLD
jgi:hypothetical protein